MPKSRSNPETDLTRAVLDAIALRCKWASVWRMNAAAGRLIYPNGRTSRFMRFGRPGQADLTGVIAPWGVRLEIEVKTPSGEQRDDQRTYAEEMIAAGAIYLVVTSPAEAVWKLERARDALIARESKPAQSSAV